MYLVNKYKYWNSLELAWNLLGTSWNVCWFIRDKRKVGEVGENKGGRRK